MNVVRERHTLTRIDHNAAAAVASVASLGSFGGCVDVRGICQPVIWRTPTHRHVREPVECDTRASFIREARTSVINMQLNNVFLCAVYIR